MSALVMRTPAGRPSRTATRAGPCDSPAVSHRSMTPIVYDRTQRCPARDGRGTFERGGALVHDHRVVLEVEHERRAVAVLHGRLVARDRQQRERVREDPAGRPVGAFTMNRRTLRLCRLL